MKVSLSQENPNRVFLSRFPSIHGYPHIFILDAAGNLIHSQPTTVPEDGRSYKALSETPGAVRPEAQHVADAAFAV